MVFQEKFSIETNYMTLPNTVVWMFQLNFFHALSGVSFLCAYEEPKEVIT